METMADHDHADEHHIQKHESEPVVENITENVQAADSSASESDDDNDIKSSAAAVNPKTYRLFGRENPVHKVLGGGKPADILLWRDKKVSAGVLGVATVIWVLFELLEYHLLSLVCYVLILGLSIIFLWSNASTFINKSPPRIPDDILSDETVRDIAFAFRVEINRTLSLLRDIVSGGDVKNFLAVIVGLWITSVLGSRLNFLSLFYIGFLLLHSVPLFYEKYENQVDAFAEKAEAELKKQYAVFHSQVLSKIPRGPLKDKKFL